MDDRDFAGRDPSLAMGEVDLIPQGSGVILHDGIPDEIGDDRTGMDI